jgi:short-subunit dehydrogenase
MPSQMDFASRWVMVTGASSGLGLELARQLARDHRANLVLVARRGDRLAVLKDELEQQYRVKVQAIVADLSRETEVDRAFAEATSEHDVYAAILNAGVTHFGEHLDLSWAQLKQLLDTNVNAVAQLTHLFLPYLLGKNQSGGVMLVASMAGITPVPYQSAYSGSKAFLVGFGHGLWHELKHTNVSVTTFVPGGIATDMTVNSGLSHHFGSGGLFIQGADACARAALAAFKQRKHTHVPGLVNQAGVLASRLLPRSFLVGQVASEYRKALVLKQRKQREP